LGGAWALAFSCNPARADVFHGNVALLGGRASGLGGAAVGLPSDDAAPFYNPAAVPLDPWIQVSFSAQALQLEQRTLSPYFGSKATERSASLVPNASVSSMPWHGGRVSFAVFATDSEGLSLDQSFQDPPPATGLSSAQIRRLESGATYQVGPSFGRPVSETLSVGVSMLYVYRTYALRSDEYTEAADPAARPAALSHIVNTDARSQGLALVGGVRFQPTGPSGRFTFGLALRSGVSLSEQQVVRDERYIGVRQPDGTVRFTRAPTSDTESTNAGEPAAVVVGGSVRLGPGRIAAQLTVTSATAQLEPGVPGKLTVDGAVGGELTVAPGWTARAGLFSQRSSVADDGTADRVDAYGATLGVGQANDHHVTDLALVLVRESGQGPVTDVTGGVDRTHIRGYLLLVTLGGAFRF